MRATTSAGYSFVLVLAGAALAGDAAIPVDDLTADGSGRAPRARMLAWPDPKGEHETRVEEGESPFACPFAPGAPQGTPGQPGPEGQPPAPPSPARRDELVTLVQAMSGAQGVTISADRRTLHVPDAAADAVRAALARIRAQRPGFVDLTFALEAGDAAGGFTTVLAGEEPVFAGDDAVFHDEAVRMYLSDFDVEIATGSQIPDPILQTLRSGTHVRLRVLPLPGRDAAVVEADAVVATPQAAEPMHPGYSEMADIDRAVVVVERAALTLRVKSGEPAACTWTGRDGRTLRLTVTARWSPAAPDAGSTALVWSAVVGAAVLEHRHVPEALQPSRAEEDDAMPKFGKGVEFPLAPPGVESVAGENGANVGFGNRHLQLFSGAGAATARDALAAACDSVNRAADLELVALDVAAGTALPADGAPPEGARELVRISAPVRLGIGALFVAGEGRTFLEDWDVEVAQASSIPDVVVGEALTGSFTNVRVRPGLGGAPAFVDLDVVLSKFTAMETQTVPVLVPMPVPPGPHSSISVPDGKGGTKSVDVDLLSEARATAFRSSYNVEKPVVRQTRITISLPLSADGRAVLRRALPGYLGAGREVVVVVRAK